VIVEILRLLNTLLSILGNWRQPLATLVLQPLVTVAMLLCIYAGWHIRDEGSVVRGLRVAFVDTRANREAEEQQIVAALLQAELQQYARGGKLIDQALINLLQHSAGAARIRLGVIHNGVSGLTGVNLLRYDIINAIAPPGRAPGALVINEPLTTWSDFLPSLLAARCQLLALADVRNFALRARLENLGANSLLACPVIDLEGKLLGAILTSWDAADKPPSGAQLEAVIEANRRIAGLIASAITLRGSPAGGRPAPSHNTCEAQPDSPASDQAPIAPPLRAVPPAEMPVVP
jgi:hypothetical protein